MAYYGVRPQFEEMLELGRAFAARLDEVRQLVSDRDTTDALDRRNLRGLQAITHGDLDRDDLKVVV